MTFFLIRHAQPEIDTTAPANEWRLSHQGKMDAKQFSVDNLPREISLLISSYEPKAIETAKIMGTASGIESIIAGGLEEHHRENILFIQNPAHFQRHVKNMFSQPDKCVFGSESANQASNRFQKSIATLLAQYPEDTIGFITHGTVISLLMGVVNSKVSYDIWDKLKLPDFRQINIDKFLSTYNIKR
jgi:broad specificity phosphatase PhoE